MRKIYRSFTCLSLNVPIGNGKHVHVSFDKKSDGSSTYTTDNEDIQKGLETHFMFGNRFYIHRVVEDTTPERALPTQEEQQPSLREVPVSDLSAAKDYIAEHFGVSRTMLRTRTQIVEHAKAHGIEFKGI